MKEGVRPVVWISLSDESLMDTKYFADRGQQGEVSQLEHHKGYSYKGTRIISHAIQ